MSSMIQSASRRGAFLLPLFMMACGGAGQNEEAAETTDALGAECGAHDDNFGGAFGTIRAFISSGVAADTDAEILPNYSGVKGPFTATCSTGNFANITYYTVPVRINYLGASTDTVLAMLRQDIESHREQLEIYESKWRAQRHPQLSTSRCNNPPVGSGVECFAAALDEIHVIGIDPVEL